MFQDRQLHVNILKALALGSAEMQCRACKATSLTTSLLATPNTAPHPHFARIAMCQMDCFLRFRWPGRRLKLHLRFDLRFEAPDRTTCAYINILTPQIIMRYVGSWQMNAAKLLITTDYCNIMLENAYVFWLVFCQQAYRLLHCAQLMIVQPFLHQQSSRVISDSPKHESIWPCLIMFNQS